VLLFNVPLQQPFFNEKVYQGSALELILASSDNQSYRDYSLAKTADGDQLFLRRGSPGFSKGLRNHLDGKLAIHHFKQSDTTCYELELDLIQAGLGQLLTDKSFAVRLQLCWPGGSFNVFADGQKACGALCGAAVKIEKKG